MLCRRDSADLLIHSRWELFTQGCVSAFLFSRIRIQMQQQQIYKKITL